jgi:hypothetical protein
MGRPVNGEHSYTRRDIGRVLQMLPIAAVLLAGGFWFAQRASGSLAGEGLYWHTLHWFAPHEQTTTNKFNIALNRAKQDHNQLALAETIEREVLPFWHEAASRTAAIQLPAGSPQASNLDFVHNISEGGLPDTNFLPGLCGATIARWPPPLGVSSSGWII